MVVHEHEKNRNGLKFRATYIDAPCQSQFRSAIHLELCWVQPVGLVGSSVVTTKMQMWVALLRSKNGGKWKRFFTWRWYLHEKMSKTIVWVRLEKIATMQNTFLKPLLSLSMLQNAPAKWVLHFHRNYKNKMPNIKAATVKFFNNRYIFFKSKLEHSRNP